MEEWRVRRTRKVGRVGDVNSQRQLGKWKIPEGELRGSRIRVELMAMSEYRERIMLGGLTMRSMVMEKCWNLFGEQ